MYKKWGHEPPATLYNERGGANAPNYTHAPTTPTLLCLPTHDSNDMCVSPSPLSFTPAPIPHPRDIPNANQQDHMTTSNHTQDMRKLTHASYNTGDHTCADYDTAEPTHTLCYLVECAIATHGMYESPFCVGNVHSLSYFQFQGIDG